MKSNPRQLPQRQWAILLTVVAISTVAKGQPVLADAEVGNNYHRYSSAQLVHVCARMSSDSHASGLTDGAWMAPPGAGRTYFYKSSCYLELARRTKDLAVCAKVRERKTLMGNGTGVSPKACEAMVKAAQAADVEQAEAAKRHATAVKGAFTVTSVRAVPQADGNWFITADMEGSLAGSYRIELINVRDRSVTQQAQLQLVSAHSQSWTVKRNDLVKGTKLPAIFPMAVSLSYLPAQASGSTGETGAEHLISVQNFTLSVQ